MNKILCTWCGKNPQKYGWYCSKKCRDADFVHKIMLKRKSNEVKHSRINTK